MPLLLLACSPRVPAPADPGAEYARWFSLTDSALVTRSPFDGSTDTLRTARPFTRLVLMSTSYAGYLEAFGAGETALGVSGVGFVTDSLIRARAREVGYEAQPDYEGILALQPDLLLAYTVSGAEPPYLGRLRSLGVRVLVLYDHLEEHPLARAEYIRLMGALTGRREAADSAFAAVRDRYLALAAGAPAPASRKVLMNIPYGDQWYIPGEGNFLSQLVRDAGGTVLGARPGPVSSVVSVEEAYALSAEADLWLHPGWCRTLGQLRSVHPLFGDFPVLEKGVYNNNLRQQSGGGNDFWESGAARPDLVLEDLIRIFSSEVPDSLHYYLRLR